MNTPELLEKIRKMGCEQLDVISELVDVIQEMDEALESAQWMLEELTAAQAEECEKARASVRERLRELVSDE